MIRSDHFCIQYIDYHDRNRQLVNYRHKDRETKRMKLPVKRINNQISINKMLHIKLLINNYDKKEIRINGSIFIIQMATHDMRLKCGLIWWAKLMGFLYVHILEYIWTASEQAWANKKILYFQIWVKTLLVQTCIRIGWYSLNHTSLYICTR